MNVTGAESIYLYGDEIAPIPAAEMRHRKNYVQKVLDAGGTVIRLTYNKHKQIEDITCYTRTTDGEIYCGDIVPSDGVGRLLCCADVARIRVSVR